MKMRYLIVAMLFTLPTIVHARWEQPVNPDRFISVGLNIETSSLSGDFTSISQPNGVAMIERGTAQHDYTGLGANLRFPATRSLTLDFDYLTLDGEASHHRNNNIYREISDLDGYRMKIGVRLYLN